MILPLIAFGAAATQKRYREDYFTCLILNNIDLEDDSLLVALRLMQCIFYAYSLIYFFLLVKMSDERIFQSAGVLFLFWNFIVFAAGVYSLIISGKSKCSGETTFSKVVTIQNFAGIAFGLLVFLCSAGMFAIYNTSGYVPLFGSKNSKKTMPLRQQPIEMN